MAPTLIIQSTAFTECLSSEDIKAPQLWKHLGSGRDYSALRRNSTAMGQACATKSWWYNSARRRNRRFTIEIGSRVSSIVQQLHAHIHGRVQGVSFRFN